MLWDLGSGLSKFPVRVCGARGRGPGRISHIPFAMDTTETMTVTIQGVSSDADAVAVKQRQKGATEACRRVETTALPVSVC